MSYSNVRMNKAYTSPTILLFVHVTYTVTTSYSNLKSKKTSLYFSCT